ncbi:hypothetical protein NGTWS0302_01460 [Mycolicibacterium cyprinidarum]|uniref:Lipoprotein LpqJ n=1 Tax=Mycolicibacterium cyprinidarum TaxID=2860311 RepID=A0ABQ4V811_9MYCO|nr:hypothetical protein NGTWS0302_01460 [Mycolicibacterium sp. NGTWS0302]GJF12850.1 hypothetical protein NGTWS1702_12310 [Mycolicibacterium sp. NGTWSNA01]
MTTRLAIAGALASCIAVLVGCQSTIEGTATREPESFAEPNFPTPRPSRPTAAPPSTLEPTPTPTAPPQSGGEVLQPRNGVVFIQTKSGKTRCQLDEQEVGCEAAFTNAPEVDGSPANGVRLSSGGQITWVLGNLGAIPAVTLDYQTYSAVGWTIEASAEGTRFTNDSTGRGMTISVEGVEGF